MLERMIGSVQAKDVCSMMGDGPALKNSDVIEPILHHSWVIKGGIDVSQRGSLLIAMPHIGIG